MDLRSVLLVLALAAGASAATPMFAAREAHRLVPETSMLAVAEAPSPMFTASTMPKVSPAVFCVIVFTGMYFLLLTVVAIVRPVETFKPDGRLTGIVRVFDTAK